jgi:hypothetical protein
MGIDGKMPPEAVESGPLSGDHRQERPYLAVTVEADRRYARSKPKPPDPIISRKNGAGARAAHEIPRGA